MTFKMDRKPGGRTPSNPNYSATTYTFTYGAGVTTVATDSSGNATQYAYDANGIVTDVSEIGPDNDATNAFASDVETLGETSYADTFAGAALASDGTVDVYSNSATDAQLRTAIAQMNTSNLPVDYIDAPKSYSDLDQLSTSVTDAHDQLMTSGINLEIAMPEPQAASVDVTLGLPTSQDMQALGNEPTVQAQFGTVTSANYNQAASYYLNEHYGPGITVNSQYVTGVRAAGSLTDESPFSGGDYLKGVGVDQCTGGFMFKGAVNPSNVFMTTAAHCGTGTYETQAGTTVGTTSARYISNFPYYDDFQTLPVDAGKPQIWLHATRAIPVSGQNIPSVGGRVTVVGAISGAHYENRVVSTNASGTVDGDGDHDTGQPFRVKHKIVVAGGVCQAGDSGGPVVLRMPDGKSVKAVGTIVAYYELDSGSEFCMVQRIDDIEAHGKLSLLTEQP